jgi:hypothetical protein
MAKRVIDLTAEELEKLAAEAWFEASEATLEKGVAVTGSRDGRRIRDRPDGREEDLGPARVRHFVLGRLGLSVAR